MKCLWATSMAPAEHSFRGQDIQMVRKLFIHFLMRPDYVLLACAASVAADSIEIMSESSVLLVPLETSLKVSQGRRQPRDTGRSHRSQCKCRTEDFISSLPCHWSLSPFSTSETLSRIDRSVSLWLQARRQGSCGVLAHPY
jgi:hypothetical protein